MEKVCERKTDRLVTPGWNTLANNSVVTFCGGHRVVWCTNSTSAFSVSQLPHLLLLAAHKEHNANDNCSGCVGPRVLRRLVHLGPQMFPGFLKFVTLPWSFPNQGHHVHDSAACFSPPVFNWIYSCRNNDALSCLSPGIFYFHNCISIFFHFYLLSLVWVTWEPQSIQFNLIYLAISIKNVSRRYKEN